MALGHLGGDALCDLAVILKFREAGERDIEQKTCGDWAMAVYKKSQEDHGDRERRGLTS